MTDATASEERFHFNTLLDLDYMQSSVYEYIGKSTVFNSIAPIKDNIMGRYDNDEGKCDNINQPLENDENTPSNLFLSSNYVESNGKAKAA